MKVSFLFDIENVTISLMSHNRKEQHTLILAYFSVN